MNVSPLRTHDTTKSSESLIYFRHVPASDKMRNKKVTRGYLGVVSTYLIIFRPQIHHCVGENGSENEFFFSIQM